MNHPSPLSGSSSRNVPAILAAMLIGLPACALAAATPERSGKEVVETVCIACHGPGKDNAPRIGNTAEWSKHASQGLKAMALTDLEMSRAISYMVSGGAAADPKKAYSSPQQVSGEQLVSTHCQNCHAIGKDGAPRLGNMADWAPRLKQGLDGLVQSSIRGHNAMPARSGMNHLSDADMKAAVYYMANKATANSGK